MSDIQPCLCCGVLLSLRQINRHLARLDSQLSHDALATNLDPGSGSVLNISFSVNLGSHLVPASNALPGYNVTRNAMDIVEGKEDNRLEERVHAFENAGAQPASPPLLASVPLHRNPPVTVEDWPDPEDDFDPFDDEWDSQGDNKLAEGDQDPPFIERDNDMPGSGPEDEPLMDNNMLQAFLEMHLGDWTQEEWFDLYFLQPVFALTFRAKRGRIFGMEPAKRWVSQVNL
ncbi:hypothetical protein BN14_12002 [Rhizoctonia solani AG-1 IB]|uniref:Uncharacterized protein n=1 Tax=Thanatephorus cucumeris (strain AG1-IB / isolate 7/3/14) TaxID=1108050 RepID=M5CHG8_THACB|nr:hypothetical protein BN14_12002 [Rhizoctonia solani AG-1 IB]